MTTTVLDEAPKTVRQQNFLEILRNEQNFLDLLLDNDDTADEITQSSAAMRVIFATDLNT
jgi:hypothetical protein